MAVHAFTKKKSEELSVERKRVASALKKAETEKKKLIDQRAEMISQSLYDIHSKEQFENSIDELSDLISDLRHRRKIGFEKNSSRIHTFFRFLELRENLVQYWNFADFEKKAIFSKIVVSNLEMQGQEVATLRLKTPFLEVEKGCSEAHGTLDEVLLEPSFEVVWKWLQCLENEQNVAAVLSMMVACKPTVPLKFPILNDMVKTSGTKN